MPVTPTIEVDDTLKERSSHGSFELPIETYTDNCQIFHSLYNHWHDEMELIYIESGSGLVRLNKEILRVKSADHRKPWSSSWHKNKSEEYSLFQKHCFRPELPVRSGGRFMSGTCHFPADGKSGGIYAYYFSIRQQL